MFKINPGELFKICTAGIGACISCFFGGWGQLLNILLLLVIFDYISGVAASAIEGRLSSAIGAKGIAKKVLIFLIVAVAHQIDLIMGKGSLLMDAAIFFYLANELLSITENAGRSGIPLPDQLKQAVEILRGKSGING
jgi:toxin secretion/phage lysis holin